MKNKVRATNFIKAVCLVLAFFMLATAYVYADELTDNNDLEMILIPEGEFIMGGEGKGTIPDTSDIISTANAKLKLPALPEKKIFVKAFYISKFEVKNRQYNEFIMDEGYNKKEYWLPEGWEFIKKNKVTLPNYWELGINHNGMDYPNYPVVGVSWYEANAFARWTGKKLPSESQWEKAARGTDGRIYPWGNEFDKKKCNSAESQFKVSTPVGSYLLGKSPYGVWDMCGNIYEWTSETIFFKNGLDGILRGGSWGYNATEVQTTSRYHRRVYDREEGEYTGIRLVGENQE